MSDDEQELEPYEVHYEGDENKKAYFNVKRDGKARAQFPDGSVYDGHYKNGLRDGQGRYTFAAVPGGGGGGAFYSGEWQAGLKHGVGTFRYPDKSRFVGEFRAGKRHGQGTYTYPNGDRFCGGWVEDLKHGAGAYVYAADQTVFTGEWNKGTCTDGEWSFHDQAPFVAQVVKGKVTQYVAAEAEQK